MNLSPQSRRVWFAIACALACGFVLACGDAERGGEAASPHTPEALADQEDAVCGMFVREQSAPRAQVVHRDGSRFFFCSLSDLMAHRAAPSPHGAVVATFIEVMDPNEDPAETHADPHPWALSSELSFVVGVVRPGVMGRPVLSYASRDQASADASRYPDAQVLDFAGLEAWWSEAMR